VRILFLSGWYPYPVNNGSKLRILSLLRGRSLCREVQVLPRKPFDPHSWRARLGFLSPTPRSVVDTFSKEMAQRIEQAVSLKGFDLVIASQLGMAGYGQHFQGLPALFEEVEVGVPYGQFAQAPSTWRRARYGLTWAKHRAYLSRLLRRFRAWLPGH
jgi:hypothetical protein